MESCELKISLCQNVVPEMRGDFYKVFISFQKNIDILVAAVYKFLFH